MPNRTDPGEANSPLTEPVSGWFTIAVLIAIGFGIYWYVKDPSSPDESNTSVNADAQIIAALDQLGSTIATAVEDVEIQYIRSYRIEDVMPPAYQSIYQTSSPKLLSLPNADTDTVAFQVNYRRTEVWQKIFCRPWLTEVVRDNNLKVVSGRLEDKNGEVQSMAVCLGN